MNMRGSVKPKNQLAVNLNNFYSMTIEHWHYDTFRGWNDKKWYGKDNVTFNLGADGKVGSANWGGLEFKKK